MTRQLNIAGKNSNEIYTLLYPNNLTGFCKYDFTLFLNHCTDLCRLAARTGEYNVDDVYSIRNSISGCHKYYEQNMRTVFEKIVIDCWIEYLCRQNEISTSTLWQNYMKCRTDFERAIFERLCEYRHNHAINQWVNLLKMQEYARKKTDFVFGVYLNSAAEAGARANYFDLMFNVAANEMGFPVTELGTSGVYSVGRTPSSPFILSTASREIVRNVLKNLGDAEVKYNPRTNPELSDRAAMDAFSIIKTYIPDKDDTLVNTIIKSMTGTPQRVYMPASFKAVIDLEIDALIESGGMLQKCPRCGEYFLKDSEYPHDYCSRRQKDGLTCLEAMGTSADEQPTVINDILPEIIEQPQLGEPMDKEYVNEKLEGLYKEMAARVNVDMTQRDFSRWYQQDLRLKEKLLLGQAGEEDLEQFFELSRSDEFASKKKKPEPILRHEEPPEEITENGKEVRKFVFERVERPIQPPAEPSFAETEKSANDAVRKLLSNAAAAQQPQQPAYYSPPPRPAQYNPPKPAARVIRGGNVTNTGYTERSFEQEFKPKTVILPTESARPNDTVRPVVPQEEVERETDEDMKVFTPRNNPDRDMKVFTPRRPAFKSASPEPTPYDEKIKQPLEEYRRAKEEIAEEIEEESVEEQLPTEEIDEREYEAEESVQEEARPAPIQPTSAASAKAISAYRTITLPKQEDLSEKKLEKADFSGILNDMARNDGFKNDDEVEVDSDGVPVSHKTKHVMNALFGPTRVSPFLKVSLDDDDEEQ